MNKHGIIEILEFALIVVLVLMCIHYCNRPATTITEYEIRHDTIVRTDTVTQYLPSPVKTRYIHDTAIVVIRDTDTIVTNVPVVQAEYRDSDYYAVVSGGYFARLDKISVFPKTVQITTTEKQTIYRKPIISVVAGVGVGYDPFRKQIAPTIGVTIGVPLKNFYRK